MTYALLLLVAGCSQDPDLPDWFDRPGDDSRYLYSIGISEAGLAPEKAAGQADMRARGVMALLRQATASSLIKMFTEETGEGEWVHRTKIAKIASKADKHPPVDIIDRATLSGGVTISLARSLKSRMQKVESTGALLKLHYDEEGDTLLQTLTWATKCDAGSFFWEISGLDSAVVQMRTNLGQESMSAKYYPERVLLYHAWLGSDLPGGLGDAPADTSFVYGYGSATVDLEDISPFTAYAAAFTSALFNLGIEAAEQSREIEDELRSAVPDGGTVPTAVVEKASLRNLKIHRQHITRDGNQWQAEVVLAFPREIAYENVVDKVRRDAALHAQLEKTELFQQIEERVRLYADPESR